MHTDVRIIARRGRAPVIRATGGLAVRQTGVDRVHLISTAATPLGGDRISVSVQVQAGARLHLHTVAATIALPARDETLSHAAWTFDVADDAELVVDPLPTIVAADADHRTRTIVTAASTASVTIGEAVQIGRHTEDAGRWSGGLHVDIDGAAALRHRLELDRSRRALISRFVYPDPRPSAVSATAVAARLDLRCGATLTTVVSPSLSAATTALAALESTPALAAL
ncbi:urease accessory protein UreD [Williamsia sp. MIQD14]|uniref:urease accessory protein UreD n=1 Tax=Williamsia sp. MIQD14 TaxID=3425703 RepID=UPI003DA1B7F4